MTNIIEKLNNTKCNDVFEYVFNHLVKKLLCHSCRLFWNRKSPRPNNETRALFFSGRPRDWRMRRRTSKRSTDRVSIELKSPRLAYLPTEGMSRKYNRVIRGRCDRFHLTSESIKFASPSPPPPLPHPPLLSRNLFPSPLRRERRETSIAPRRRHQRFACFERIKKNFFSFLYYFFFSPPLSLFFLPLLFAINNIYY